MHPFFPSLTLLIVTLLISSTTVAKPPWRMIKQQQGISIYAHNNANTRIKTFKGEVVVKSSLAAIAALLEDVPAMPRWMYETKSAKILKKINQQSSYVYVVTDMPWPFINRDSISLAQLSQDKQTRRVIITIKSVPGFLKPKPGFLRIVDMQGRWVLTPRGKGLTHVVYEMRVNPGGNLPKWLVNAFSVDMPFETLVNLRKEINRAKYINARRSYIQEPVE